MTRKELNIIKARDWYDKTENDVLFRVDTDESIKDTKIFKKMRKVESSSECPLVIVECSNTLEVISRCSKNNPSAKIGVLNFSAFFKPGGGFMTGAYTQEESLCHSSNLYNILSRLDIYKERKESKNIPPEFTDEVIYTPTVRFEVDDKTYYADVLSCSAPNCNRARVNMKVAERALRKRIKLILNVADNEGIDTLILGAWGCGVSGNSAEIVSHIFKEEIIGKSMNIKTIIFPIPNGERFKVFLDAMC